MTVARAPLWLPWWIAAGCSSIATDPSDSAAPDTADSAAEATDTAETAAPEDADNDGFTVADGDCDDSRPHVHPGAPDYCDGLDADCDGEPIPPGSCSQPGDPSVMWTWSIEPGDYEGIDDLRAGDLNGDGLPELLLPYRRSDDDHGLVIDETPLRSRPPTSDWADPDVVLGAAWFWRVIPTPDADGDGLDDLWLDGGDALSFVAGTPEGFNEGARSTGQIASMRWTEFNYFPEDSSWADGPLDLDGDDVAELLVFTRDATDQTRWLSAAYASDGIRGDYGLERAPRMRVDTSRTDSQYGGPVGDLDGDGCGDAVFYVPGRDGKRAARFLPGADWVDDGQLEDATVLLEYGVSGDGKDVYAYVEGTPPEDFDGDGLADSLVFTFGDGESCSRILTGGLPSGQVDDWTWLRICNASVLGWYPDSDGDGIAELWTSGYGVIPSTEVSGGGTFELPDLSLVDTEGDSPRVVRDLDGDGLPEWVYVEFELGTTYIVGGFPLPIDDPTKW